MVMMRQNQGQKEETWDFGASPMINVPGMDPATFQPKTPPAGWKKQMAEPQPAGGVAPGTPTGRPAPGRP